MARFKISESNLNEFFGLFKSKKPKDRKAIEKEIEDAGKRAKKQMDNDPWVQNFLKKHNIDVKKDFSL